MPDVQLDIAAVENVLADFKDPETGHDRRRHTTATGAWMTMTVVNQFHSTSSVQ
jgi:hypothetical protein